ncbi:hypothetical protein PanWU01x14_338180 [Parasponia andersonii]|uniref:Uncharacterized protein n=1 Tax=Parasponia andersonii TaxID=3476 RepID=A0A2P5AFA4_PARAD|nr:hypothetical protein PanWU01x14_338180 [Parasponia andersonii]
MGFSPKSIRAESMTFGRKTLAVASSSWASSIVVVAELPRRLVVHAGRHINGREGRCTGTTLWASREEEGKKKKKKKESGCGLE